MKKQYGIFLLTALLVLDQAVKFIVKTHMTLNESIAVFGRWFYIRFIENPGAAYGMEFGGDYGKLLLSLLRIVLIGVLIWYIHRLYKKKAPVGVLVGCTLVLAGAIGNMIDCAFYGLIFSSSDFYTVATLFPEGGGYTSFLHGYVVDMLYFPIIRTTYPAWVPGVGGEPFTFFSPVFNLADAYITVGFVYLLLFQRKYFR